MKNSHDFCHRENQFLRKEKAVRDRMSVLVKTENWRGARKLQRLYLRSISARFSAVKEANRRLKPKERFSLDEINQMAKDLNVWEQQDEVVCMRITQKLDGTYRPTLKFGIRDRAVQVLLSRAMEPFEEFHKGQFSPIGAGGVHAACKSVATALTEEGGNYRWIVKLDLKNAYQSVPKKFVELYAHLPRNVTQRSLGADIQTHQLEITNPLYMDNDDTSTLTALLSASRRGIPQGSALSPRIFDVFIAHLLSAAPKNVRVVSFADDILLMVPTREELAACYDLRREIENFPHRVDCERVQIEIHCAEYDAENGFDFLGQYFKRKLGRTTFVRPSERAFEKFDLRLINFFSGMLETTAHQHPPLIKKLRSYLLAWPNHYPLWDRVDRFRFIKDNILPAHNSIGCQ